MSEPQADSGAAVPCISLLADQFVTFDSFIGQCDSLAKDIAEKNPFRADADGKRMALLVAIAREWHTANKAICVKTDRDGDR